MSRLDCIEKRAECNKVLNELSIAINDSETLAGFSESTWDLLKDHLAEDLQFIQRVNDLQKSKTKVS